MAILLIIIIGPLLAAVAVITRSKKTQAMLPVVYAAAHMGLTAALADGYGSFSGYFRVDEVNILFLAILSFVFAGVSVYNFGYISGSEAGPVKTGRYTAAFLVFASAMTAVLLSANLGLMWVFIEATTLASAYLIYYKAGKPALEAAWKYIFICSIGIAFAFAGIIFLSAAQTGARSLMLDSLNSAAPMMDRIWLKIGFVLMIVGFGTKAGLAPVHSWLPDAHSEAPSPVSAMLSATLLNSAMLAIIRIYHIMESAGLEKFASSLLMVMGLLSVFVAAVYIMRVGNYKRMLAYSSIENMGVIAAGISMGRPVFFAVMIQAAAHSFSKAAFFLTSGNILKRYDVKEIAPVTGLLRADPATAWLWMTCFAMISAMPPSPLFISEFYILRSMFLAGKWPLAAALLVFLTVIVYGMASAVIKMCFGEPPEGLSKQELGPARYLPQAALLAALIGAGFYLVFAKVL
jgi:hydrogenase-4 component F